MEPRSSTSLHSAKVISENGFGQFFSSPWNAREDWLFSSFLFVPQLGLWGQQIGDIFVYVTI